MAGELHQLPLDTVVAVANWLLTRPLATVADVMAEFDLSDDDALVALALARAVIRERESEAEQYGG